MADPILILNGELRADSAEFGTAVVNNVCFPSAVNPACCRERRCCERSPQRLCEVCVRFAKSVVSWSVAVPRTRNETDL